MIREKLSGIGQRLAFWPLLFGLLLFPSLALGQAVLNPNQLKGTVSLNTSNPEIAAKLEGTEGMYRLSLYSYPTETSGYNSAHTTCEGGNSCDYEMTLEAAADGTAYDIDLRVYLDRYGGMYHFYPRLQSAKLYPEPAEDIIMNIEECVGMVRVNFVDGDNQPQTVQGGEIIAYESYGEWDTILQHTQARGRVEKDTSSAHVILHGNGEPYRIQSIYEYGTDLRVDRYRLACEETVTVACDEIVDVTCQILPGNLGKIHGTIDMLGVDEHGSNNHTFLHAWGGPFNHNRYHYIDANPSSGEFTMHNMVPDEADSTRDGYYLHSRMTFGEGHYVNQFYLPVLGYASGDKVSVEKGKTTELGNALVIDPSTVFGNVTLAGRPDEQGGSCLRWMKRGAAEDRNNDGVIDYVWPGLTGAEAIGAYNAAPGAIRSASGGRAHAGFGGDLNQESGIFLGDYQMRLGGLYSQPSYWKPKNIRLHLDNYSDYFSDRETVETLYYEFLRVKDYANPEQLMVPGEAYQQNHNYCLSEVQVTFQALAGTIYTPELRASGRFEGTDYRAIHRNYGVWLDWSYGMPYHEDEAADTGLVRLCLPQGTYTFDPHARAINPSGGTTWAAFPKFEMEVGCQQEIAISTELQIGLHDFDRVVGKKKLPISGKVKSQGMVTEVRYSVNGSEWKVYCENCGESPEFFPFIELVLGDNELKFAADDEFGNTASVSAWVEFRPDPIEQLTCRDITVDAPAGAASTTVGWGIGVNGGCDTAKISCSSKSGGEFPLGSTDVTCTATDSCGSQASCEFSVTVNETIVRETPTPVPTLIPENPGEENEECPSEDVKPIVFCGTQVPMLWPPNHKFVDVQHYASASNSCDGRSLPVPVEELSVHTTVWSDETEVPEPGDGSGYFAPDAEEADALIQLRRERRGTEDGRVYLLISESSNSLGNSGSACCTVVVPHDMSTASVDSAFAQAEAARKHCNEFGTAPEGYTQHGVSEELKPSKAQKRRDKRAKKKKKKKKKKGKRGKKGSKRK